MTLLDTIGLLVLIIGAAEAQVVRPTPFTNRILQTSATCDNQFIYFRLNFERPFRGLVYTENAFPHCVYVNGSADPQLVFDFRIPLNDCRTRVVGGSWENAVVVQRDLHVLESSDQKFLLSCRPGTSGNTDGRFTVSFGGVTVDGRLVSTELVTGAGSSLGTIPAHSVEIQLGQGPSGPVVSRPVNVGDALSYVVRVQDLSGSDARLGRCWANDGLSEIVLSDERGCTVHPTGNIWGNFRSLQVGNGKTFYNDIRAWAFPTSNRVNLFCNLHICPTTCPSYSCQTRQKRNSDDAQPDSAVLAMESTFELAAFRAPDTLQAEFRSQRDVQLVTGVVPPESDQVVKPPDPNRICLNQIHFGVGIALLLLIIILSMAFILTISYRACRKSQRKRPIGSHELPYPHSWGNTTFSTSSAHK